MLVGVLICKSIERWEHLDCTGLDLILGGLYWGICMQGEYVYCEGVKYSLSCLGASMVLSGSMVTSLFTLQVLLISGSKGISSESSDRRPSIQQ